MRRFLRIAHVVLGLGLPLLLPKLKGKYVKLFWAFVVLNEIRGAWLVWEVIT